MKRQKLTSQAEQFAFGPLIADLHLTTLPSDEKEARTILFGESMDPDNMITEFEKQIGITKTEDLELKRIVYKSVMLQPGSDEDDQALLYQLLNDKELYPNMKETSNWTNRGDYNMFVIYQEDLDVKERRKQQQQQKGTDE